LSATARDDVRVAGNAATAAPRNVKVQRLAIFRNGLAGYSGARDVTISNQNGGNGLTQRTGMLQPYLVGGPNGYEKAALLRFNSLNLPAGAQVTGAALTVVFHNFSTGFALRGRYLKAAWSDGSLALGWQLAAPNQPWTVPGAKGEGSDVVLVRSFLIETFAGSGDEVKSIGLDVAVVQQWVADPATNQGLILVNQNADKLTRLYSSEASVIGRRPMLQITYVTP